MAWVGGLAEWEDGDVTYLSVAFTYKLNEAYERAQMARFLGRKVVVGGPALFLMEQGKMFHPLNLVATVGSSYEDAKVVCKLKPKAGTRGRFAVK